jgi:hypothetical protein
MNHFSTLSDSNYLVLGLVLYESLKQHTKDFTLHYLALDDISYNKLIEYQCDNLKIYKIDDIRNKEYEKLEQNNANVPNRISPYHYMMCSFFNFFLLKNLPHILYIDADICFYDDASHIINCCDKYDMGFITHKHTEFGAYVGFFNVGVIYFKNSQTGWGCLEWWKDIGLNPNNEWAKEYGTCGDQKYLELFWKTFGKDHIKVIDSDIGHSAPWNVTRAEIHDGFMTWESSMVYFEKYKTQKLYFHHFSHFKPLDNVYKLDWEGEWGRFVDNPGVPQLYDDYYGRCKSVMERYNL